jgi:hypothetical protein
MYNNKMQNTSLPLSLEFGLFLAAATLFLVCVFVLLHAGCSAASVFSAEESKKSILSCHFYQREKERELFLFPAQ